MNADIRDILFLDIETVAATPSYDMLGERLKYQWARKSSFFKRDPEQTDQDLFDERAGIYAEFGKVIVIGMGKFSENETGELILKTKALFDHDEKKLLTEFGSLLEKMGPATRLCAHNGREFDFPYLCRRLLVNGLQLPSVLNLSGKKPWEVQHLDTLEMWKFGDYKHYTSLDLLAALFNISTSKGVMDGSQVNEVYYQENNLTKIAEYCIGDIIALAQVFLKMRGLETVYKENIIRT